LDSSKASNYTCTGSSKAWKIKAAPLIYGKGTSSPAEAVIFAAWMALLTQSLGSAALELLVDVLGGDSRLETNFEIHFGGGITLDGELIASRSLHTDPHPSAHAASDIISVAALEIVPTQTPLLHKCPHSASLLSLYDASTSQSTIFPCSSTLRSSRIPSNHPLFPYRSHSTSSTPKLRIALGTSDPRLTIFQYSFPNVTNLRIGLTGLFVGQHGHPEKQTWACGWHLRSTTVFIFDE